LSDLLANLPKSVRVVEVGPRDGLQNEELIVSTSEKLQLILMLAESGLEEIEVSGFVHPQRVPQLADAAEIFAALRELEPNPNIRYSALVPNRKGLDRAI